MATYSSSVNTSASNPVVIQTPQSQYALAVAQMAAAMGAYAFNWAKGVFQQTSVLTEQMINNFLQTSQIGLGLANTQLQQYEDTTVPEMNQLASEAGTYSGTPRVQFNMGAAGSDAAQAAQNARANSLAALQAYGVDPSSGMYGELLESQNTAAGANIAGAEQQAEINTENTGRTLLQNSIAAGEQLPGDVVNSLNSAYAGITGAENAEETNAQTGATLMQTAAPFEQAAISLKYPQVAEQSSSHGAAQSSGGGGGGGGGQKQQQQPQKGQPQSNGQYNGPTWGQIMGAQQMKDLAGQGQSQISVPQETGTGGEYNPNFDGGNNIGSPEGLSPDNFTDPSAPSTGQLGNDPFYNDFRDYGGDQSNPFTNSNGSGTFGSNIGADNPFSVSGDPSTNYGGASSSGGFGDTSGAPGAPGVSTSASGTNDGSFDGGSTPFSTDPFNNPSGGGTQQSDQSGGGDYGNPFDSSGGNSTGGGGNYGGAPSGGDYGGGGGGYYARGGPIGSNFARGGSSRGVIPDRGRRVPPQASPTRGRQTDDVHANLNVGEFVVPKDATAWYGQKFFQDLIKKSRKAQMDGSQAPARPQNGPPTRGPVRFSTVQQNPHRHAPLHMSPATRRVMGR